MEIIGEVALSALFEVLFDKLTSSNLLKIFQQQQVHVDLNKWKKTLLKIHAVLDDAKEKRETSKLVKIWLDEPEDLAYDVDDILDKFATEVLRRKFNAEPSTSKVRKFIPACCVDFSPSSFMFDANMWSKIADIDLRLQRIVTEKNGLDLRGSTGGRIGTERSREATTSLVNERCTYGRDGDKKAIINLLLSIESSNTQLSVIPIVDMRGLGKTTLAQLVYNDDDVSNYFDLKAWVCVSEDFDIVRGSKEILKSITFEHCNDGDDLNSIQVKLKEKLNGKKFLVILDDVWNEDYNNWTQLCCPFEFGALGSKIIVTTRIHEVSKIMETTSPYKLRELSNDACRCLFLQHALGSTDFVAHPGLQEIGREIFDLCKGSPLAAKVLGGALRTKRNPNEWKNVLNSKIWEKNGIIPVLELSYQYLPSHLKRCFAYCSLFPKDYEFEESELVLLWMAEGLVQETERKKSMEVLGVEYVHDLLMRSLFQQSNNNESLFVMHDLINDLARWAARGIFYRMEDSLGSNKQSEISTKLPSSISDLKHLRYLNLSNTPIRSLPEATSSLYNLQTLMLKRCHKLTQEMPMGIEKLKNLHTVSNFVVGKDKGSKIGDLMNLEFLRGRLCISSLENVLDIEDTRRASLNGKKNLDALEIKWGEEVSIDGYIGIKFPTWLGDHSFSYIVDLKIARCAKCKSLPAIGNFSNLKFFAIKSMSMVQTIGPEFYGDGFLKPFQYLEILHFEDMQQWQDWIPYGVEYREFPHLRELYISQCPKLQGKLPHHLPSLENFSISNCEHLVVSIPSLHMLHTLKIVGCKEVLKFLEIANCSELTSLSSSNQLPMALKQLEISNCKEIKFLPEGLHKLCHLNDISIVGCCSLVSFPDGGFLPTHLRNLSIRCCEKLKALPRMHMVTTLDIYKCPSI
ncbi:hypothetical protein ACB092_11G038000, partial [Castanea dentata]